MCWTNLKDIKFQAKSNIFALKYHNNEIAVTIQAKNAIIIVFDFHKLLLSDYLIYRPNKERAYPLIIYNNIEKIFFYP